MLESPRTFKFQPEMQLGVAIERHSYSGIWE